MKQVSAQVLDLLTPDQRRAIEALCYNMEATDDVLAEGYDLARELAGTLSIKADRVAGPDVLLKIYDDAIVNLKRLIEMCDYYLERRYLIILTKQYNRLDYEEL